MTNRTLGFSRLDSLIAEHGEDWLLNAFVSRIAEGESPGAVSTGMGLPWFVMRSWLEDAPERMKMMELGKRCFADGLVWESLKEARDADSDTVSVARLRADHFSKMAGKLSRDEWGDKQQVDVKVVSDISISSILEEARGRVIDVIPVEELPPLPVNVINNSVEI